MSSERDELTPEPPDPASLARLRAALASAEPEPGASPAAPVDPETIWAAVRGELAPADCVAIVDRLHRDPELAREWRLALALVEDAPTLAQAEASSTSAAGPSPTAAPANDRRYWYAGALALIAAAAVVIIVVPRPPGPTSPGDSARDPAGLGQPVLREAEPAAAITSELDGARLPADAFALRWTAVPGALRYELRLTTRALEPVWEALDLTAAEATVPAAQLEALAPGSELIWQVTAVMPDGQRRSSAAMSVTRR